MSFGSVILNGKMHAVDFQFLLSAVFVLIIYNRWPILIDIFSL